MSFKLASWNINGIRAILKKGNLLNYISQSNPDVLCLNEIRIDQTLLESSGIPSYFPSYPYQKWSCSSQKGYSGVAILSKQKPLKSFTLFPNDIYSNPHDLNGRLAIMEFENVYIISIYSPNSGLELKNLWFRIDNWEIYLRSSLKLLNKRIILCGDLNVAFSEMDVFNAKSSRNSAGFTDQERESFGLLLKDGMVDCFRRKYPSEIKYTWWNPRNKMAREQKKGWRLDYFLVDGGDQGIVKDCLIRDEVFGSDHCPLELLIELNDKKL